MQLSMHVWAFHYFFLFGFFSAITHETTPNVTSLTKLVLLQTIDLAQEQVIKLINASAKELIYFETIKQFAENEFFAKQIIRLIHLLNPELQYMLKLELFQLVPDLEYFLIKQMSVGSYSEDLWLQHLNMLKMLPHLTVEQALLLITWYTYQKIDRPLLLSEEHVKILTTLPREIQGIIASSASKTST